MSLYRIQNIEKGTYAGRQLKILYGSPMPFGPKRYEHYVNFSVFSKNAKAISILFFEDKIENIVFEYEMNAEHNRTGDVWHCAIEELPQEWTYLYRVFGPYDKSHGFFFNDKKLVLDPYARCLVGKEEWGKKPEIQFRHNILDHPYKCAIAKDDFDWEGDRHIHRKLCDTIIYEMHVRGYTIHPSANVMHPGSFAGIIEKIPYLKKLGVTAIELMPINEFDENECMFSNPKTGEKLKNYWGYSSVGFFAPKSSYASRSLEKEQITEFKQMVKELHKEEIEVILDVVFNHTAEGNTEGPTISFRGLENNVYYIMADDGSYMNFSGCGNTMNCNHPVVREMILECLRYWVTEMHVDGFRFDLASILGRDHRGHVLSNPPILESIALDPILSNVKIIAEAWDAAGLYQVGRFPAWERWSEWNDKYRDTIRKFVKGDRGMASEMATRIAGSSDLYGQSGRKPYHSINYITCHDGFTLNDLFSYNQKYNIDNGESNNDGSNANYSWNCGYEGETSNKTIIKLRKRQMKNSIALLLLSQGTPMLLAGDEFGRTQRGNNNAYCQDNEISWIDWSLLDKNYDLFYFTKEMISFRKSFASLRRETFFTGEKPFEQSFPDISWHSTKVGKPDFGEKSKNIAFVISGSHAKERNNDIYVAVNPTRKQTVFRLPPLHIKKWYLKADTFNESPHDICLMDNERLLDSQKSYTVHPHSLIILLSKEDK